MHIVIYYFPCTLCLQTEGAFFNLHEHHEIDRKICYAFVVRADFTLVGEHDCTLHIVVRIRQECIQCTVYGIILTGFHLHRKNGETLKVAQKKVDFALCLVLLEKENACLFMPGVVDMMDKRIAISIIL